MKGFVIGSVALAALIGNSAFAADMNMPLKAPAMAPAWNWSGFYIGLNAGGAWGRSNVTYVPPGPPFTGVAAAYSAIGSGPVNSSGFTGGAQAGYNWQSGLVVFGLEGDINAFDLHGGFTQTGTPPGNVALSSVASIRTDWLATVRGRLGLAAFDRSLFYVTGGLAVTDFKYSETNTYNTLGTSSFSSNQTRAGWTVGGGWEYGFIPHWSVKVEYLYMDFGSISGQVPGFIVGTGPHLYAADLKANLVRGGINYHF